MGLCWHACGFSWMHAPSSPQTQPWSSSWDSQQEQRRMANTIPPQRSDSGKWSLAPDLTAASDRLHPFEVFFSKFHPAEAWNEHWPDTRSQYDLNKTKRQQADLCIHTDTPVVLPAGLKKFVRSQKEMPGKTKAEPGARPAVRGFPRHCENAHACNAKKPANSHGSIYLSSHPSVCKSTISFLVCLSVYLSLYLSIYLSTYLSTYCTYLSIYLSIYPSIYLLYLSIYLSICLSICLSIYLSVYLSIGPLVGLSRLPACLPACLSVCLSILRFVHLSVHLSIYLSVFLLIEHSRCTNPSAPTVIRL